jgi:hypothetical protein
MNEPDESVTGAPGAGGNGGRVPSLGLVRARWEGGVRIPTARQALAANRLGDRGLAALHANCPHRPEGDCPIEAAEAAAYARSGVIGSWLMLLVIWAVAIPVAAMPWKFDLLGWPDAPIAVSVLILAGCVTVVPVAGLVQAFRRWENEASIAASGPTCDPWPRPSRLPRRPRVARSGRRL